MLQENNFKNLVKEKFHLEAGNNHFPDQTYINRLIASLDKVEANSYNKSQSGFNSEFKYLKGVDVLLSITDFVEGCLNQLLWINSILESGKYADNIEDLEKYFDYNTPSILGDSWTLDKVTKKGVFFRGAEPFQGSRVIINSENIIEIVLALSAVAEKCKENISVKKNEHAKCIVEPSSKAKESSLFTSKELEIECINVLKEIKQPVLDVDGNFLNGHGMKGAVVVWYDKCKFLGFMSNVVRNRDEVAIVVMELIPKLTIDGSSFEKSPVAIKYKEEIEKKLAQISH